MHRTLLALTILVAAANAFVVRPSRSTTSYYAAATTTLHRMSSTSDDNTDDNDDNEGVSLETLELLGQGAAKVRNVVGSSSS
jgi:hypothetical protein